MHQALLNKRCLYDRSSIDRILDKQAVCLNQRYETSRPLVLCVMTGALVYVGNLLPRLNFSLDLDYIHASRYGANREGGQLNWLSFPKESIVGREVILLDDILDEGKTLHEISNWLINSGASSVEIAVLLHKEKPFTQPCVPNYPALPVSDQYVYGFGLDADGLWRNANGIFIAE